MSGVSLNRQENSKLKTASGVVESHSAVIISVDLVAAAAAATLTIYDAGAATGGTEILKMAAVAGASTHFVGEVVAKTGLYAELSGAGAGYIVRFD